MQWTAIQKYQMHIHLNLSHSHQVTHTTIVLHHYSYPLSGYVCCHSDDLQVTMDTNVACLTMPEISINLLKADNHACIFTKKLFHIQYDI